MRRSSFVRLASVLVVLSSAAWAGTPVSVPGDVGIGPAAYFFFGKLADDQVPHAGLKVSLGAVLDQQWLRDHQDVIPGQYRRYLNGVDEVSITPSILIPDSLIISPKILHTGIYGATWKPLALGLPLTTGTVRVRLNAGLDITYAYIYSDRADIPTTHFIRPGAEVGLEVRFSVTRSFLFDLGWESQFYVPQELGGFGIGTADSWVCHVGQAYLRLHFRFPFQTTL